MIIKLFIFWPGLLILPFACSKVSLDVTHEYQTIVLAAVSVSPWDIAAGCATKTFKSLPF